MTVTIDQPDTAISNTLSLLWPRPRTGASNATHSLAHLTSIKAPFHPLAVETLQELLEEARSGTTPTLPIPHTPKPNLPRSPKHTLIIGSFIDQGRVWSAFHATSATSPQRAVVKFTAPSLHLKPVDELYHEITHEAGVYEHIPQLQGGVVPAWRGVFASTQHVRGVEVALLAAVVDYAGVSMEDEIPRLTMLEKVAILNKYRKLHRAGVVHISCRPKHWLKRRGAPVAEMRLVDFGLSVLSPVFGGYESGVSWRQMCEEEIAIVSRHLRMPGFGAESGEGDESDEESKGAAADTVV